MRIPPESTVRMVLSPVVINRVPSLINVKFTGFITFTFLNKSAPSIKNLNYFVSNNEKKEKRKESHL